MSLHYSSFNHQVEGAFTQGLGLFTMEQCVYLEGNGRTQRGQLYTTGPGTYKIPAVSDIPVQLNVTLLDGTSNPQAIFSSKVAPQCQHNFTSSATIEKLLFNKGKDKALEWPSSVQRCEHVSITR